MSRFIAVCLACILSPAAVAQWALHVERPLESAVDRGTLEQFGEACRLSDAQEQAATRLFEAHVQRFEAFVAEGTALKEKLNAAVAELPEQSIIERGRAKADVHRQLLPFAQRQRALDARILNEWKNLLADEQVLFWEPFVLNLRRERWQHNGRYTESDIDLIAILDDLEIDRHLADDPEYFNILLSDYARQMDAALQEVFDGYVRSEEHKHGSFLRQHLPKDEVLAIRRKYNATFPENLNNIRDQLSAQQIERVIDARLPEEVVDDATRKSRQRADERDRAMRNLNRQYRDEFLGLLPEKNQADLIKAYDRQRFGMYADPNRMPAMQLFGMLEDEHDLTESQQQALDELRAVYHETIASLNRQLANARDAAVRERYQGTDDGQRRGVDERLATQIEARYTFENETLDRIWAMLSEQQQSQIRKPDSLDPARFKISSREDAQ